MEKIKLTIENGALQEVPVWESHRRGQNWLAVIDLDPTAPGGLRRRFATKAHGDYYYMLPDLQIGDAIEFGADYYTTSGRKRAKRWYGVVTGLSPEYVELLHCESARKACEVAKDYRATGPVELTPEEQALVEQLKALPPEKLKAVLAAVATKTQDN